MENGAGASDSEIEEWLKTSPWGRCVYHCDNDAVDHQVVAMEFDGGLTATFTMTAFDRGRDLVINGTRGSLRAGETLKSVADIVLTMHDGETTHIRLPETSDDYASHGGADRGMIEALDVEFSRSAATLRSGLHASVESHMIAFAAEQSRRTRESVSLEEYRSSLFDTISSGG